MGNIALFPVKCPMHYEACEGGIDAQIAKRVLSRTQYDRFIEFSDRALYGEGMRCIFCNNFVNYPESSSQSMVECPYCVQRFCIRCKKPWHYGARCPLVCYSSLSIDIIIFCTIRPLLCFRQLVPSVLHISESLPDLGYVINLVCVSDKFPDKKTRVLYHI